MSKWFRAFRNWLSPYSPEYYMEFTKTAGPLWKSMHQIRLEKDSQHNLYKVCAVQSGHQPLLVAECGSGSLDKVRKYCSHVKAYHGHLEFRDMTLDMNRGRL